MTWLEEALKIIESNPRPMGFWFHPLVSWEVPSLIPVMELTLDDFQVSTKLFPHSHSSAGQGDKTRPKILWVNIRTGKSPIKYTKHYNTINQMVKIDSGKINLFGDGLWQVCQSWLKIILSDNGGSSLCLLTKATRAALHYQNLVKKPSRVFRPVIWDPGISSLGQLVCLGTIHYFSPSLCFYVK